MTEELTIALKKFFETSRGSFLDEKQDEKSEKSEGKQDESITGPIVGHSASHSVGHSPCHSNCCVIYVRASAAPGGDGLSWATAFQDFQSALNLAAATGGANEIWVAKGTYKPTVIPLPDTLYGQRPSFAINDIVVNIYGGFHGNECRRSDRDFCKNKTIFSGDILGDDLPPSQRRVDNPLFPLTLPAAYLATKDDNARHVFGIFNSNVTFDGVVIEKGFAGTLPFIDINNYVAFRRTLRGGGIYTEDSKLLIRNTVFYDNETYDAFIFNVLNIQGGIGGALYSEHTKIIIDNTTMKYNYANFFSSAFLILSRLNRRDSVGAEITKLCVKHNEGTGCTSSLQDVTHIVRKSNFQNNYAAAFCGALQILALSTINNGLSIVEDSRFESNTGGVCGALDLINRSITIGQDILPQNTGVSHIRNNVFCGNISNLLLEDPIRNLVSCGAICDYNYNALIEDNIFEGNSGLTSGAICVSQTYKNPNLFLNFYVAIRENCFAENHQVGTNSLGGGAIHFLTLTAGDILNNRFIKNHAAQNGGAIVLEEATVTVKCNEFCGNRAVLLGNDIYSFDSQTNNLIDCNNFKKFTTNSVVIVNNG